MASNNRSSARRRKAQSTLEYSVCIFAVAMAVIAMIVYVKRGISGRYADVVRATVMSADANQYEPYYKSGDSVTERNSTLVQGIFNRGERVTDSDIRFHQQGNSYESGDPE